VRWLLLIVLIGGIAYASLGKFGELVHGDPEPLHESSYVVVYGRDTCGVTSRMLADLDRSGIPYEYKRVDEPQVANELHPRMEAAGLNIRRYGLPVVDVNAEMIIRPNPNTVAEKYQQFAQAPSTRVAGRGTTDAGPGRSAVAATQHMADPLVKCTIDGHQTFTLQSQCPQ
jgi:hypothetical protein